MAIEYQLTLAGDLPLAEVAHLAAPEATEEPALPGYPRLFGADLKEARGYYVDIVAGRNGYYEARDDNGSRWEWEPDDYVDITFRLRKDVPFEDSVRNMVAVVARVLAARPEDAALVFNGILLLLRVDGVVSRRASDWWEDYGLADVAFG